MFEIIKHRLDDYLINYFDKVEEIKSIGEDGSTYYIFYKPYDEISFSLIYDPYTKVILKGDINNAPNEVLMRYLFHVVEEKKMTLEEFCKWEGVTQIK